MERLKEWWEPKSKPQKKKILMGGVVALLFLIIAGAWLYRSRTATVPPAAVQAPAVDAVTVQRRDMKKTIALTGATVPDAQIDLMTKFAGKIAQINVVLGQSVAPGEILLMQDTSDIDIAIEANRAIYDEARADTIASRIVFEANYQKAQANYQHSLTSYERYKTLFDQGAISREMLDGKSQDVSNAKAELDALAKLGNSAASVKSKRAAQDKAFHDIQALQNQRDEMILRAPRSGIIGYRLAEVGNMAQPGQKLLSIIDNSIMHVDCVIPEQDVGQLTTGMGGSIEIESVGKAYTGHIVYVSPSNDLKTQSFSARITLDSPDSSIKAGMFARTTIEVILRPRTIFVPKQAVLEKNGIYSAFVIDAANLAQERVVKLGLRNDKEIEILEGISELEQVATTNLSRLKTGMKIQLNVIAFP